MQTGEQDVEYVRKIVGCFSESPSDLWNMYFLYFLAAFVPIAMSATMYYYTASLDGVWPYFLGAAAFAVWLYRLSRRTRSSLIEFRKDKIIQTFKNGTMNEIFKKDMQSAYIRYYRGNHILMLGLKSKELSIGMNKALRQEFLKNA